MKMNEGGVKRLSYKKLFLVFGCLLIAFSFFFILKLQGNPLIMLYTVYKKVS
jgi:hypothetical protein